MALFKISKGLKANLPSTKTEGYCYYTTDDSLFYIDYKDSNGALQRKALNAQDAETLMGASLQTILNSSDIEIPTSKAVLAALAGKSDANHAHDGRYYTETEIDSKVSAINTLITNITNGTTEVGKAARATSATSATRATIADAADFANKDVNGNVITSTYETKTDAENKLVEAKNYTNGKIEETEGALVGVLFAMYGDDIPDEDDPPTIRQIANDEATTALNSAKEYADSIASNIPDSLSDLSSDATHRTVTDAEKAVWNAKSNFSGNYNDLSNKPTIPSISGLATEGYVDDAVSNKVDKVSGKGLSTNDYTTTEKNKLSGIAANAEVNQNAFTNIVVGSTTIAADTKTDSLTLDAGSGISLSGDATNDKVTITNSGVLSVATGTANGTISVNTNGTAANVSVKGLGSAAYTASTAYDSAGTGAAKADAALAAAKKYTDDAVAGLVDSSPDTLNTLNELAAALGDDPNFATTVASQIGAKVDKVDGKGLSTNDYTTAEKNKLSGIATGAEVNQNAFSNITIGSTTIAADTKTDTLTLVAGTNVTLTPDATNDKITIAATDTVYTHPAGSGASKSSGLYKFSTDANSHISGVTAVVKADITGLGIPAQDTTYGVVSTTADGLAPKRDGSTTKFLRGDGTWAVPPDTDTKYTHPTTSGNKHIPSGGSSGQILRWSADGTAAWGADNNTTYSAATTSADGLMTSTMVTKLNGIAEGANAYSLPTASSSTLGGIKVGSNLSISNGVLSVPAASGTTAGVTIVYPAASCTTFSSDSGTVTPLAVQKGAKMFAITRPTSSTDKAITRYSNTTGDVQDSKIIIEDVTNTRDTSKKAQVIAIPAEGGKKMVYGYCTDQVDGTSFIGGVFDASATSYPYAQGLAIGGSSGNLLWKGKRVLDNDDLTTLNSAINGKLSTSGTAAKATALASSAGSATQPVYFSGGKPVATTYTLGASVPSGAKFTDTTYSNATTSTAGLMSAADKVALDASLPREEFEDCIQAQKIADFTNKLPTAKDSSGAVFNGVGYVSQGNRWNGPDGALTTSNEYGCTGFIPVTNNSVIRGKGLTFKGCGDDGWNNVTFYDSSFKRIIHQTGPTIENGSSSWYAPTTCTDDSFEMTAQNMTNLAYVTFTWNRKVSIINEKSIITVNEPITYHMEGEIADGIVGQIYSAGTTAPSNTKLLWVDTTANTGGLKYYNGTAWVHVPVAFT